MNQEEKIHDFEHIVDMLLEVINEARARRHFPDLQDIKSIDIANVDTIYRESLTVIEQSDEDLGDSSAKILMVQKLNGLLQLSDLDEHGNHEFKEKMLSRCGTHFDAELTSDEGILTLTVHVFNLYLEVSEVGKVIEGDLVVQGSIMHPGYGPVLCLVEFQSAEDDSRNQSVRVAPWEMLITPAADADSNATFMIPVSFSAATIGAGSVRVEVFVDQVERIPYSEEPDTFEYSASKYIRALHYMTKSVVGDEGAAVGVLTEEALAEQDEALDEGSPNGSRSGSPDRDSEYSPGKDLIVQATAEDDEDILNGLDENNLALGSTQLVVQSVKIATDYDDLMALQAEGYEVCCEQLTEEGTHGDQEHMWKFHVCAMYGPPEEGGLEDIIWLKTPKSIGTLAVVKGYTVFHDSDLTEMEDDYSVYLAVKIGPNPKFTKLTMIQCNIDLEPLLRSYLKAQNCLFRKGTTEICASMQGLCGLALKVPFAMQSQGQPEDDFDKLHQRKETGKHPKSSKSRAEDDDLSKVTDDSSLDDEDDDEYNEEDIVRNLVEELEALRDEKTELLNNSQELQKRCVTILHKERSLQIQNTSKAPVSSAAAGTAAEILHHLDAEQLAEKEKLFNDTLDHISDSRAKLERQQAEFDQLALDLQTRLDDKEFKAGEIGASFKEFKREILAKAVNSRTGKTISKRLINQFEMIELKREEDLERVRLKNISLRTTLRKLNRALQAKEHLAEGLHMIDFEQLKIENQTLNEKIEERNEELAKLKRKKTVTVQVLTHIREKLRFVEKSNGRVRLELEEVEAQTLEMRSVLAVSKRERDSVKIDNKELRRQQGFATSDLLLVDFESRKGALEAMKAEIRELKAKYNVLAKQAGLQTGSLVESPPVTAPMRSASAGMAGRSLQASGAPLQVSHA